MTTPTTRTEEVLNQTKLNWTVREEEVQTKSGIIVVGSKAIVREDTNKVLAIHGEGYFPYQNSQMVELLDRVSSQLGLPIHRGGAFGNGEKVFIQLKSNDMMIEGGVYGSDTIKGFITCVNSFDGSTSLAFGPSTITISCQNKFFASFRGLKTKVRHTKGMIAKIDEICESMELAMFEESEMFKQIKRFSESPIKPKDKDWITRLLFNIEKEVDLNDGDAISTVTRNKVDRFNIDMITELKGKGENLWGLMSSVTRYTTHSMNKGDADKNEQNKMFSTMGMREREIYNKLVEVVK